jgi:hypothetical protein
LVPDRGDVFNGHYVNSECDDTAEIMLQADLTDRRAAEARSASEQPTGMLPIGRVKPTEGRPVGLPRPPEMLRPDREGSASTDSEHPCGCSSLSSGAPFGLAWLLGGWALRRTRHRTSSTRPAGSS